MGTAAGPLHHPLRVLFQKSDLNELITCNQIDLRKRLDNYGCWKEQRTC